MSFNYNDVLKDILSASSDKYASDHESLKKKYSDGEFRLVVEQARYPLANLKEIFREHDLHPKYQRNFIWDDERKSRLIESYIINIPIPPVFLYEYQYSKYEVMDGVQRISTTLDFLDDKFRLVGLEFWAELNGKNFSELLPEIQNGIKRRYLSATILMKESTKDAGSSELMKQLVFERLNTGGVQLNPQEIRNALYHSNFFKLLSQVATDPKNTEVLQSFKLNTQRMEIEELVLRFFAYKSASKHSLSKSTKTILDTYARKARDFKEEEISELGRLFRETFDFAISVLGKEAFRSNERSGKNEKMIYDTVMLACANLIELGYSQNQFINRNLGTSKYDLIKQYKNEFNGKATSMATVNHRVKLLQSMILGITENENSEQENIRKGK